MKFYFPVFECKVLLVRFRWFLIVLNSDVSVCVNWVACILERVRFLKSSTVILWELTCESHQEVFVLQKFLHLFHVTTLNGLLISYVRSLNLYNLYPPSFPSSYPIFQSFSSMPCIVYGATFAWNVFSHHFSIQKEAT